MVFCKKRQKCLRFVHPKGGPTLIQGEIIPNTTLKIQDIVFKESEGIERHVRIFLILKEQTNVD